MIQIVLNKVFYQRLSLFFLIILFTTSTAWADASGYCGDPDVNNGHNVTWTYVESTKTLTISGTGATCDCNASLFQGSKPWAFEYSKVIIEEGVTSIGELFFQGCWSTSFSIIIPKSITYIDYSAFDDIQHLDIYISDLEDWCKKEVDFSRALLYFSYNLYLNDERIHDLIIPNSITSITDGLFYGCGLSSVKIPNSVTRIGGSSFARCGFSSITIPNSVTSIGSYAFEGCNFNTLIIPNSVEYIGYRAFHNCNYLTTVIIGSGVERIFSEAFYFWNNLNKVYCYARNPPTLTANLPNTYLIFPDQTLEHGTLYVPKGSKEAYQSADGWDEFHTIEEITDEIEVDDLCYDLDLRANEASVIQYKGNNKYSGDIVIPETVEYENVTYNVTGIESSAFIDCNNLSSISIPASITSIDGNVLDLSGCTSLSNIYVNNTNANYKDVDGVLFTKDGTNLIAYPLSKSGTSYNIPENVTNFNRNIFAGCTNLKSIIVNANNANYKDIDGVVFTKNANTLIAYPTGRTAANYAIEANVTSIGQDAFRNCTNLTSLEVLATTPPTLGSCALEDCENLASIIVPVGKGDNYKDATNWSSYSNIIRAWDGYCGASGNEENVMWMYDNGTLTISGIGAMADFEPANAPWQEYCQNDITKIVISDGITTIGTAAFGGCFQLTDVYIPNSVTSIGMYGFCDCHSLTNVSIPGSVTTIDYGAFQDCSNLKTVNLPSCLTTISDYAFSGCIDLSNIILPNSIESVGSQAFNDTKWYDNQSDGVVYVGKVAYKYKGQMPENTYLEIIDGTISISSGAFKNFSNLVEVFIPESVCNIGEWSFYGCTNLTKVKVGMKEPSAICKGTFSNRGNAYLYVPTSCKASYLSTNVWNEFLAIIEPSDLDKFSGGIGIESDPYIINTIEDMNALAKDVNSGITYEGIFFKVTASEMNFLDVNYTAIGTGANQFAGNFNGNDVVIKNLKISESPAYKGKGLFGYIGEKGCVSKITMDETCSISGSFDVGGIVGANKGSVSNCINKATIYGTVCRIGGICGDNMGTISSCSNYGDVKLTNNVDAVGMMGGIAGDCDKGIVSNCNNYGDVTALGDGGIWAFGGIVGLLTNGGYNYNCTIDNCINKGNVIGKSNVGGITGNVDNHIIRNCSVSDCLIQGTNAPVGTICDSKSNNLSSNFYTPDVVVKVGNKTYEGFTARGVCDESRGMNIMENNGAMLKCPLEDYLTYNEGGFFEITSVNDLKIVASLVSEVGLALDGKTFKVTVKELNLKNEPIIIGQYCTHDVNNNYQPTHKPFSGVFDGNGVVIKNLNIENKDDNYSYYSLFAYNKGTIKNIIIDESCSTNAYYSGGIVSVNEGIVSGCVNKGLYNYGGIAYKNSGTISNNLVLGGTPTRNISGAIVCTNNGNLVNNFYRYERYNYEIKGTNNGDISENYGAVRAYAISSNEKNIEIVNITDTESGIISSGGTIYCANGITDNLNINYVSEVPEGYKPLYYYKGYDGYNKYLNPNEDDTYSITIENRDVSISADFEPCQYKLTYYVDNEEYDSNIYYYKNNIIPIDEPTKDGYTFSGWSEIPETMPAHDVTVTGTFSINKYKLVYKVDDEEYKSCDVEYGAPITPEAYPEKETYKFSGWSEIPETMPAKDVTITGTFERYYTVGNVVKLVNFVTIGNATTDNVELYDQNSDGELNIGDIILVVKWILNNDNSGPSNSRTRSYDVPKLALYTAAQFDVKTTADTNIREIKLVKSMEQTHQMMYQQKDANTYTVVVYSLSNQLMKPENGGIVEIELDNGSQSGLTIENVIASLTTGEIQSYSGGQMTTNIQQIESDGCPIVVYDLNGNRMNGNRGLKKGVYIVNGKKVIIK